MSDEAPAPVEPPTILNLELVPQDGSVSTIPDL